MKQSGKNMKSKQTNKEAKLKITFLLFIMYTATIIYAPRV